ncbi:putative ribonuclease H-like domain-containing protein [Tanacetum coccineum]
MKVEEHLHITFLENKPNVAGSGPDWLFDIDLLTNSMNYEPVTAGNQTNKNAGIKYNVDAVPTQQYILLPLLYDSPQSSKDAVADDAGKKTNEDPAKEDDKSGQGEATNTNSTNRLNTVSSLINTVSSSFTTMDPGRERVQRNEFESVFGQDKDANGNSIYRMFTPVNAAGSSCDNLGGSIPVNAATLPNDNLPTDPLMPDLEDTGIFSGAYDDEDVGAEADLNNLETTMNVKPKKVTQALTDLSWIEAFQDELPTSFSLRKCWILVDLPKGKHAIGTKWVYRNKKNERGIVVRNKARLVAQGYIQEKGIDYDDVFAPVARIEAIRLFLPYALFIGFIVYQMDVKSAFLYGTIEEEVYVCQPLGFEDPQFPDKVYKVEKALYGLHQALRAWYETLSTYLLENVFRRGTINKTLFIKKDKGDILLVQVYVDDIIFGSTKKSLCVEFEKMMHKRFQMSSMGELTFFLGLQVKQKDDGIFISQDKYVANILKKFDFVTMKTASTPIETNKALLKDEKAEDVDVHLCRSMIGSLMYLTASRPDIMFAVFACARFQVTPKVSHLHAVKRIFRYLKDETVYKKWEDRIERAATTASSLEAEQDGGNINKTQSMATLNESFPQGTDSSSDPRCQDTILGGAKAQIRFEAASKQSNDPPLSRVNTLGSGEDIMKLKELMELSKKDDDQEEEEMKKHIDLVKDDEVAIDAIPLAIKPSVILQLLSDYYCWKDYADRDEIKD